MGWNVSKKSIPENRMQPQFIETSQLLQEINVQKINRAINVTLIGRWLASTGHQRHNKSCIPIYSRQHNRWNYSIQGETERKK